MSVSSRPLATSAVLLALVVAAFEATVVTSAMPTIALDLGGLDTYGWVFSSFLLSSMVGILVCGKLADALGRRPVFVTGMGLFLAGSILCALARSTPELIAYRVAQGLGAGAIQPIAMTISADLYTLRERARVQALFTGAWGSANALGPLLGGWIVMHGSWRWVFLVNVPVGAVTVVMLLVSYRDPPMRPGGPVGAAGAFLAGGAAAIGLLALDPAGRSTASLRPVAAVAALAAFAFLWWQQRRTLAPILPAALLPDPVVRAGVTGGVFAGGLLYTCSAYVPLWLAVHEHESALTAGAALMPLLVGWAIGSTFGVHVMVRWGMRVSVAGGFGVATLGAAALFATVVFELPHAAAFAALGLLGLGLGPAASTSLVGPQSHVAWRYRGMITSTMYASRTLGGSLAIATLGSPSATPAWRFAGILVISVTATVVLASIAPSDVTEPEPGV